MSSCTLPTSYAQLWGLEGLGRRPCAAVSRNQTTRCHLQPLLLLPPSTRLRRYYSHEIHQASFVLPAFAQMALAGSLTSF